MRKSISPAERLIATLRFLSTGNNGNNRARVDWCKRAAGHTVRHHPKRIARD